MNKHANKLFEKNRRYLRRKNRTNTVAKTVSDLPRLVVNRSNKFNYAQIIDENGKVIAAVNDVKTSNGTKVESAKTVGVELAKAAVKNGVEKAVFDRNGYLYHGRVKAIADGAREGGLNI